MFGEPIHNQTVAVGREAVFSCVIHNIKEYQVSDISIQSSGVALQVFPLKTLMLCSVQKHVSFSTQWTLIGSINTRSCLNTLPVIESPGPLK